MRKNWSELTPFLRVPAAPLDNNVCKRALFECGPPGAEPDCPGLRLIGWPCRSVTSRKPPRFRSLQDREAAARGRFRACHQVADGEHDVVGV